MLCKQPEEKPLAADSSPQFRVDPAEGQHVKLGGSLKSAEIRFQRPDFLPIHVSARYASPGQPAILE